MIEAILVPSFPVRIIPMIVIQIDLNGVVFAIGKRPFGALYMANSRIQSSLLYSIFYVLPDQPTYLALLDEIQSRT